MEKLIVHATMAGGGEQKTYAYMARISGNDECSSGNFGDSS